MFWITLISVGSQSSNAKKRKTVFRVFLCRPIGDFSRKTFFEWLGKKYHWAHRIDDGDWKLCFRKCFWMKFLSVKKIFTFNYFFSQETFLKKTDWFGTNQQWVYTRMMIDSKVYLRMIVFSRRVFARNISKNIVISGSTKYQS